MNCPVCEHPETDVKDSRPSDMGRQIRRRRGCRRCGTRFTTMEAAAIDAAQIKRDLFFARMGPLCADLLGEP